MSVKKITVSISFEAANQQSDELATAEITETITGLANSLRTQVNAVKVSLKF